MCLCVYLIFDYTRQNYKARMYAMVRIRSSAGLPFGRRTRQKTNKQTKKKANNTALDTTQPGELEVGGWAVGLGWGGGGGSRGGFGGRGAARLGSVLSGRIHFNDIHRQ